MSGAAKLGSCMAISSGSLRMLFAAVMKSLSTITSMGSRGTEARQRAQEYNVA